MLSIVVVTHNSNRRLLAECLDSIAGATVQLTSNGRSGVPQVIVVDNGSQPEYKGFLEELGVDRLLLLEQNLGFGAAANRGTSVAIGDHILFLNPDAALTAEALVQIDTAIASGGLDKTLATCWLVKGGSVQVDAYTLWRGSIDRALRLQKETKALTRRREPLMDVSRVCGGALLGAREDLVALGPFDEAFFLYGEDVDLSLRAKRMGLRLVALGSSVVDHVGAASMASEQLARLVERCRVDATLRISQRHGGRMRCLAVRLELWLITALGMVKLGKSSASRMTRAARFVELRRWGLRGEPAPLSSSLLAS